ncbi:MAG: hypothetical protein QXG67_04090 [Candidatus Nitrosotenuis sp.]|uniref:DUF7128 family protein n=1 Tax=Candidatus Nitrosotenuis uzonensis TaxID=1407055 RepID=UPI0019604BBD|nr:hypothetical protein [Candidatus Nitrosotenuis uzonensis]MCA2003574.1 hypothetical protein [Candidatus Nitrosotenuis sp.]
MVKDVEKDSQRFYLCEACGFGYKDAKTAKQCEDYCNEHQSCSREITKQAVLR